jgi:isoleucyl-tRNA synthetase
LHEALRTITLLMAPFVPFITERVWQDMFKTTTDSSLQSVHLADWPEANKKEIRTDLIENMGLIRRLVELGRGARAEGKVKNRQPLSRALVSAKNWDKVPQDLKDLLAEELNILDVQSLSQTGDLVNVAVKANFRTLGARYAKETPAIAQEITNLDATSLVKDLRDNNKTVINVSGQDFEITSEDVIITETPREGWSVMSQDGETIALDLEISAELRSLGISREVIRMIQEARKTTGLDVSDRINLEFFTTDSQVLESIKQNIEVIKSEVLALKFNELKGTGPATTSDEDLKLEIWIKKA